MSQPSGEFRQEAVRTRGGELVSGGLLVGVGAPDGSEARTCPEEWRPRPRRTGRSEPARGPVGGVGRAVGPLALGAGPADLPMLDREVDVVELLGLLSEGRSIRLVGQAGSGRSALLSAVAEAAADLAPGGVVQLCGHRRTLPDLLQDLFAATHHAPGYRPDPGQLAAHLAEVGAIVVIDSAEPAGAELEQLLAAAPGCAFLISAAPDGPPLPAGSRLQDHLVAGLSRSACLALTARLAGRPLDVDEKAWAVDLWFESEGLPLRFVQAAALLRQRDVAVDALVAAEDDRMDVFGAVEGPVHDPDPAIREDALRRTVPLPSVAETASPAVRLAEGLSEPAQAVLRLAVALGGECPTAPHLPALIDVGQGEAALAELADAGLAVSIGGHHRLTAGAQDLLAPHWPARGCVDGAAQHFAWWVGHSSVTLEQIAAEAEVMIGVLLADRTAGRHDAVVRLARAAAPALALSLRWGAWERVLQLGLEAARQTGSAVDQAWFHHEAGVHAICLQQPSRAIAELETALTLRAAAGDQRGVAAVGRMLDLLRAEGRQLPAAAPAVAGPGRAPVISKIAARVPARLKSSRRRRAAVVSTAVLTLGVLGTAVAMSFSGPDEVKGKDPYSGRMDGGGDTQEAPFPQPSGSTGAGTAGAGPGSPAGQGSGPQPSTSGSASHASSASPTRRPSSSPGAGESQAPQQSQPPAPGQSQPPVQPPGQSPPPQQTGQPSQPPTTGHSSSAPASTASSPPPTSGSPTAPSGTASASPP
ncbi:ATP-binding protein [Kitasatospora xanthocidica]|uniref:ATP-binding protein n=1 Tax=Kitasatospora xanthocidica TaxID=83382 RepID=A0A373A1S7_9ACTN|nr:ATP-binding protein [Kitasatospora xanthocidica]RGD61395.1 ATP-binding protein [Kitasatospora xanthocidica]